MVRSGVGSSQFIPPGSSFCSRCIGYSTRQRNSISPYDKLAGEKKHKWVMCRCVCVYVRKYAHMHCTLCVCALVGAHALYTGWTFVTNSCKSSFFICKKIAIMIEADFPWSSFTSSGDRAQPYLRTTTLIVTSTVFLTRSFVKLLLIKIILHYNRICKSNNKNCLIIK